MNILAICLILIILLIITFGVYACCIRASEFDDRDEVLYQKWIQDKE